MGGSIQGKFAEQNDLVVSGQVQSANNNQASLNAALADANHLQGTNVTFQPSGLLTTIQSPIPSVAQALQGTVGAALGGIGQQGTPSEQPGGGGIPCPEVMQYVWVQTGGVSMLKFAGSITLDDYLWNPISKLFEKVAKADIVEDVDLWEVLGNNTAHAIGSFAHPLIQGVSDTKGLALEKCSRYMNALSVVQQELKDTFIAKVFQRRKGSVMHLETEGEGHIYCAGTDPNKMFAFHNLKPNNEPE